MLFDDISGQKNHPIEAGKYTAETLRKKENDKGCLSPDYTHTMTVLSRFIFTHVSERDILLSVASPPQGTVRCTFQIVLMLKEPSLSVSATVKST